MADRRPAEAARGSDERAIRSITLVGAAVNVVLSIVKLLVGYLTGSYGLVADGFHSLSDLVTDAAVVIGTALGSQPPDRSHPYGHGKFETFATVVVGVVLLAVAAGILWESVHALYHGEVSFPGVPMIVVALVSIGAKEALYQATARLAEKTGSQALGANAWHHRSDALSSVAVLLGAVGGLFGWGQADQVAGALVGVMLGVVAVKVLVGAFRELSEAAIEPEKLSAIREVLDATEEVVEWHNLRTRRMGRQILIDAHVLVDPAMTVRESHAVTERLEDAILGVLSCQCSVTIHVEPFEEAHRLTEGSPIDDTPPGAP